MMKNNKQNKIFISHSSKDIDIVEPFVRLLRTIGVKRDNLFCSSLANYGIPAGENIYNYLASEFNENNLYVIFVLSNNYYDSAACLNEMGAAWVLKNKHQSILLPGFDFSDIKGAIDPRVIAIHLEEDNRNKLLGDLKENIIAYLNLLEIDTNEWESDRNDFLDSVDKYEPPQIGNKKDKEEFVRSDQTYMTKDGNTDGPLYCTNCYDTKELTVQMNKKNNCRYICPHCNNHGIYDTDKARESFRIFHGPPRESHRY